MQIDRQTRKISGDFTGFQGYKFFSIGLIRAVWYTKLSFGTIMPDSSEGG